MSKLRIFIEGKELDSLESVTVPITKQFEELSNPTVICNDYSKTVTVPLSKNNNEIFGHCYNPDRLISASSDDNTPLVGIYFDPYKKLDCRLQWRDDVFFTGYAKMLKVTNKGYEITINGELGKIFQELQKISFQKSDFEDEEDIERYWIDGSKYVDTTINRDLVYKCWNSQQDDYTLRETTDSNYDITDIIGFIPNNSYSSDFDYTTVELTDGTSKSIEDYLGEDFETNTGYSRDSVIGDGLLPACTYQYRSYEQIPFIYWNKFWQIFQKKSEELTGYSWDLDSNWFFDNNKNFNGLGITLLQRDSLSAATDGKTDSVFSALYPTGNNIPFSKSYSETRTVYPNTQGQYLCVDGVYQVGDGEMFLNIDTSFSLTISNPISGGTTITDLYFVNSSTIHKALRVQYIYGEDEETTLLDFVYCHKDAVSYFQNLYPDATVTGISWNDLSISWSGTGVINFPGSGKVHIKLPSRNDKLKVRWTPLFEGSTETYFLFNCNYTLGGQEMFGDYTAPYGELNYQLILDSSDLNWYKTVFRSGSKFTLNDICNFDFSNILDYCKRFRINIYVDEVNKKLKFSRSLFSNYTIVDKTDRIDKSTFDVSPITFDNKYVSFSYKESGTQIGQAYKKSYKYPYGAKRLTTEYNFNTETNTLFEKSCEAILYSPTSLNWFDISSNKYKKWKLIFWVLNNNYLECRDDSGNTVDVSGVYFYPTRVKPDYQYGVTFPWITDDSDNQKLLDTYYNYANTSPSTYGVACPSYWTSPELVLRVDGVEPAIYHTCLFEKPKKNYVAKLDYWSRVSQTVYHTFWEKYINERYNVQNKKVTTYVRLTPSEFINFKFNQFWKIGNQIYIVNKIYDYDITSDKPVKVDLITVQDIDAYKD